MPANLASSKGEPRIELRSCDIRGLSMKVRYTVTADTLGENFSVLKCRIIGPGKISQGNKRIQE